MESYYIQLQQAFFLPGKEDQDYCRREGSCFLGALLGLLHRRLELELQCVGSLSSSATNCGSTGHKCIDLYTSMKVFLWSVDPQFVAGGSSI
jgi:hypothetical protein